MSKIVLLAAGAAGYVLGARAGRERYDQIVFQAQNLWTNPQVQKVAKDAQDLAREKAPDLSDKLSGAAKQASGSVASIVDPDSSSSPSTADSPAPEVAVTPVPEVAVTPTPAILDTHSPGSRA